jgi:hypothetical protein
LAQDREARTAGRSPVGIPRRNSLGGISLHLNCDVLSFAVELEEGVLDALQLDSSVAPVPGSPLHGPAAVTPKEADARPPWAIQGFRDDAGCQISGDIPECD